MITEELVLTILEQYSLPWHGRHGVSHWARVLETGRRLAVPGGARIEVVELFAVFHDAKRVGEGIDAGHGERGAEFAASLRGSLFELPDDDFALLHEACARHTDGLTEGALTIQACWDSDRLDLGRIGKILEPAYLCTDAAKSRSLLDWAWDRGRREVVPAWIAREWGVDLGS